MAYRTVKEMTDLVIACSYPNTPCVDGFKTAGEVIRQLQNIFLFDEEEVIESLMEMQCMRFEITDNSGFPNWNAGKTFAELRKELEKVLDVAYDGDWESGLNMIGTGWIDKNGMEYEVIVRREF